LAKKPQNRGFWGILGVFGPSGASRGLPRGSLLHQPPARPREGAPGPLEGAWEASRALRDPGGVWGPSGDPGTPGPRSGTPARGGFYINPSRRGPAVPGGVWEGPPGPGSPKSPISGKFPKIPQKRGFWALPGGDPQKPQKGVTGGSPRGVDVKPPSRGSPGRSKRACFGQKGQKRVFWPKNPKIGDFGVF